MRSGAITEFKFQAVLVAGIVCSHLIDHAFRSLCIG